MRCLLVLFLAALGLSHAQQIHKGQCPVVQPVENFKAADYLGKWYENQRYSVVFEFGQRCSSATYSARTNDSINVLNKAISNFSGTTVSIEGYATLVDNGVGHLKVVFPSANNNKADYVVLGTDYKNWAAVYSCTNSPLKVAHATVAWLLTRSRNPSQEHVKAALEVFKAQHVDTDHLRKISQEKCGNN